MLASPSLCRQTASAPASLPTVINPPRAPTACRDECPEQGMLMVALDVLGRVHAAVMEALRAAPLTLPGGEVVYQNWDVRQALAQERQKVGRAGGLGGGMGRRSNACLAQGLPASTRSC